MLERSVLYTVIGDRVLIKIGPFIFLRVQTSTPKGWKKFFPNFIFSFLTKFVANDSNIFMCGEAIQIDIGPTKRISFFFTLNFPRIREKVNNLK